MGTHRDLLVEVAEPGPWGCRAKMKHLGGWQRGAAWPREPSLPTGMETQLLALNAPLSWSKPASHGHARPSCRFWHSLDVLEAIRAVASEPAQQERKVRRHPVTCK